MFNHGKNKNVKGHGYFRKAKYIKGLGSKIALGVSTAVVGVSLVGGSISTVSADEIQDSGNSPNVLESDSTAPIISEVESPVVSDEGSLVSDEATSTTPTSVVDSPIVSEEDSVVSSETTSTTSVVDSELKESVLVNHPVPEYDTSNSSNLEDHVDSSTLDSQDMKDQINELKITGELTYKDTEVNNPPTFEDDVFYDSERTSSPYISGKISSVMSKVAEDRTSFKEGHKPVVADDVFQIDPRVSIPATLNPTIARLKEDFNVLPAGVRELVKSVVFTKRDNGVLGWTQSIGGNVFLNTEYFHPEDGFDLERQVMYHEIGHVIDGTSVAYEGNVLYSASRDKLVQPLLKRTYPLMVNYESFANTFMLYNELKFKHQPVDTTTEAEVVEYFDELLRGIATPKEGVLSTELKEVLSSLNDSGIPVVYDGNVTYKANDSNYALLKDKVSNLNTFNLSTLRSSLDSSDVMLFTRSSHSPENTSVYSNVARYSTATLDKSAVFNPEGVEYTINHYDFTDSSLKETEKSTSDTGAKTYEGYDLLNKVINENNHTINYYYGHKNEEGYSLSVMKNNHTEGIINSNKESLNNTITLTTTDPHSLNSSSKVRVTYWSPNPHTAVSLTGTSLSDGRSSVTTVTPSNDSTNVLGTQEISIGAKESGSVVSLSNVITPTLLSEGQEIYATYSLIQDGQVIAFKTEKYKVSLPDSKYGTSKFNSSEYLTTFDSSKSVTKTIPMPYTVRGVEDNSLIHTVEITAPDGFVITEFSKSAGWVQDGNKVTKTFYNRSIPNTLPIVTDNNAKSDLPFIYATAFDSKLEFDTSAFGTYDELLAGKDWTLNTKVTSLDEMGYSHVTNLSDSGTLRAKEPDKGVGSVELKSLVNDVPASESSAKSPTEDTFKDTLKMTDSDYSGGKFFPIPEMHIKFDKSGAIGHYTAELNGLYVSEFNYGKYSPEDVKFDIYSLDDGSKLGSVSPAGSFGTKFLPLSPISLPNDISGVRLVPVGSVDKLEAGTLKSLTFVTKYKPTPDANLSSRFAETSTAIIDEHKFIASPASPNEATASSSVRYSQLGTTVETYKYYGNETSVATGNFGQQQYATKIKDKPQSGSPSTQRISLADLAGDENAKIVMTVPKELTVTLKDGSTISGGTFVKKISDFEGVGFDDLNVWRLKFDLKPTSSEVDSGIYDIAWYMDWSGADEATKSATDGVSPIEGNEETTKNVASYKITNGITFGTQTRVSSSDGSFSSKKSDVVSDTDFKIKSTLINTQGSNQTNTVAIQYLPIKGFEGSTYTVSPTGAITGLPIGWVAYYSSDMPTGDRDADNSNLSWVTSPEDFSTVKAIKIVQTTGDFSNGKFISYEIPVKTTETLGVDDIAKTQIGIKSDANSSFVMSSPAEMTPKSYLESWVTDEDEPTNLKDPKKSSDLPNPTTEETFPNYVHKEDKVEPNGNVIHVYSKAGSVTQTTVLSDEDGSETVLSPKEGVVTDTAYGTHYETTAKNVPEPSEETRDEADRVVTVRTTYTVSTPENATGEVNAPITDVKYVVTPVKEESFVMKTGSVTQKTVLVDESGRELEVLSDKETVQDSKDYGTSYSTISKNIPEDSDVTEEVGDKLVRTVTTYTLEEPENKEGTINAPMTDVVFKVVKHVSVTEKDKPITKGSVTQTTVLVTDDGEEVLSPKETVVDNGAYGSSYSTTSKNVPENSDTTEDLEDSTVRTVVTYSVSNPENAKGVINAPMTDVKFVVTKNVEVIKTMKTGTVTETTVLVDESGKEVEVLSPKTTLVDNGDYGTSYTSEAKNIPENSDTSEEQEGKIVRTIVTYTLNSEPVIEGVVNSTTKDIKYIVSKHVETIETAKTGNVTQTTVLVDSEGNPIEFLSPVETVIDGGDFGTPYSTEAKNVPENSEDVQELDGKTVRTITTYTVSTPDNASGSVIDGTINVKYVVTKNVEVVEEVKTGSVTETTILVDSEGNKLEVLSPKVTVMENKDFGTGYSTSAKNVPSDSTKEEDLGNKIVKTVTTYTVRNPENARGTVVEGVTDVVYTVVKNVEVTETMKTGTVTETTILVDDQGNTLQVLSPKTTVSEGDYGTSYSSSAKNVPQDSTNTEDFDDHVVKTVTTYRVTSSSSNSGVIESPTKDIVYKVVKNVSTTNIPKVGVVTSTTILVDDNGKQLKVLSPKSTLVSGNYGVSYNSNPAGIPENSDVTTKDGDTTTRTITTYTVKVGNISGTIDSPNKDLTHIVTKHVEVITTTEKRGTVVVEYVDDKGATLIPSETPFNNVLVGSPYDTTPNSKPTLTIGDSEYKLVSVEGKEKGEVGEGSSTVKYVYSLVPKEGNSNPKVDNGVDDSKPNKETPKGETVTKANSPRPEAVNFTTLEPTVQANSDSSDYSEESLPSTGESSSGLAVIGLLTLAVGASQVSKRKRKED